MASIAIVVLGVFVGLLTLGQGLAIVTFGIPTANQWLRDGRLVDARPLRRYRISLLLLAALFVATITVVALFMPAQTLALALGLGVGVVAAIAGLRKREDLLADFMQANASSLRSTHELRALDRRAHRLGVSLREIASAPPSAMEVIGEFSTLLVKAPCQVRPESLLPRPKAAIKAALDAALQKLSDSQSRKALQMALLELNMFVPDSEVPQDPEARSMEYLRRLTGHGQAGPAVKSVPARVPADTRHRLIVATSYDSLGVASRLDLDSAVSLLETVAIRLEGQVAGSRFPLLWRLAPALTRDVLAEWAQQELPDLIREIDIVEKECEVLPAKLAPRFCFGAEGYPEVYSHDSPNAGGTLRERFQRVIDRFRSAAAEALQNQVLLVAERRGPAIRWWDD